MNTNLIGNQGEAKLLYELTKRGIPCFIPYGDGSEIDLIAIFNGQLNRIQVKTCQKLNARGSMECKLTRQEGYHGNRIAYKENSFDYYAFYCIETDTLCLVKVTPDLPQTTISFQIKEPQCRTSKIRMAEDYSIDKVLMVV